LPPAFLAGVGYGFGAGFFLWLKADFFAYPRPLSSKIFQNLSLKCEGVHMTGARIDNVKNALGLTNETREQNARQNLDRALIEIEQNEGRADADCRRRVSRVVGQLATVEWLLRAEDK